MSLLHELLSGPSAQDRFAQVQQLQGLSGGRTHDPRASANTFTAGSGAPVDVANDIARWLERKGFQVSGLEGFQGTGQISTGHIENSQHYSGHAGDVTYSDPTDPRWASEGAALDWAERKLQQRWDDALTELIWREPGHWSHLHYGTRPGG